MPSFLDRFEREAVPDDRSFGSAKTEGSPQRQELSQQHVVLRPAAFSINAIVKQEDASARVVFTNVDSESAVEFTMQGMDPSQYHWSMPFSDTRLPPGVYMFYFMLGSSRMLSDEHPIMGDMNVAIFSDALRRYIIGHGEVVQEEGPLIERRLSLNVETSPKESGLKRRVASYGQGLHHVESSANIGNCQAAPLTEIFQRCRSRQALFSEKVFAGLYDSELALRLHMMSVHTSDCSPAFSGGNVQIWAGSARLGKQYGKCEDACFVSTSAAGVADGVGGMAVFASFGVDSAKLASELMEGARSAAKCLHGTQMMHHRSAPDHASQIMSGLLPNMSTPDYALELMKRAEQKATSYGASTMLVAVVQHCELGVANLGDSGFLVLRRGRQELEIVARSTEQHHHWNCPYQLTRLPDSLSQQYPCFARDTPDDAHAYCIPVQEGDLLLFFSDGLRDNLHDREILHIAECALPPDVSHLMGLPQYKTSPETIANSFVQAAYERSRDPKAMVPFAQGCREYGYTYEGGKEDDITVVAAWVVQDDS